MEYFQLTKNDIKRFDMDAIASLKFKNNRSEQNEKVRLSIGVNFNKKVKSCSDIVTEAIKRCSK
jgi:aspartate/tyrosine/aromatic aminotransferase